MNGLKDHQIAQLTNAVRDELKSRIPGLPECLRTLISGAMLDYLEANNLRIDGTKTNNS